MRMLLELIQVWSARGFLRLPILYNLEDLNIRVIFKKTFYWHIAVTYNMNEENKEEERKYFLHT
jgi:hypothetical protein